MRVRVLSDSTVGLRLVSPRIYPIFIDNIMNDENIDRKIDSANSYPFCLGMLCRVRKPNGTWVLKVVWKRLLVFFFATLAALYLLLSIAIYAYYKFAIEYSDMTFTQAVCAPFDRASLRVATGDYNIAEAEKCIKERKWREAYKNLAFGVGRSPKNIKGVMLLAEFYISPIFSRPDIAVKYLEQSLVYAKNNTDYIRLYMRTLIDLSEDRRLIGVGEKLLAGGDITNNEVTAYLAMSISSVYALHGNFAKSKEFLVKYGLDKTLPGILRISKNEWEQGNREEAIKVIADNFDFAKNKEPLYALLVNYYTAMGDFEKARQYSMLRSIENPFSVEQRMEYINLQAKSGEKAAVKDAVESAFRQYAADYNAMLVIGNYAADNGDIALMRRIYENAIKNNFQIGPFCLLFLETMITNGDYKNAVAFSEDILKEKPVWIKRYDDVIACLRAVSYYATGNVNMSDILLKDVLNRGTATPRILVATARRIEKLGGTAYAQKLLENAVERFPRHQLALTRLVQLDIKQGNSTNLDKHIVRLLSMRRPPRELVLDARKNLGSDRFIFTNNREKILKEIDTLVDNKNAAALSDYTEKENERILQAEDNISL